MAETLSDTQHAEAAALESSASDSGVSKAMETTGGRIGQLDWKQRLSALQQHARAALERLSSLLHRRRSASGDPTMSDEMGKHLAETLESFSLRQDSLETMLTATVAERELGDPGRSTDDRDSQDMNHWQAVVLDRLGGIEQALHAVSQRLEDQTSENAVTEENGAFPDTVLQADESQASPPAATDLADDKWMTAILGASLYNDPQLGSAIGWLQTQVLAGDLPALSLLGQLLVFRCANADRKPTLLKDIGEAYYRCFPKSKDANEPFERALAEWVGRHCQEGGLPNSIELVYPGDRFDATRHAPLERGGVEVADVLGWIVLRDAGKVFAKATVSTR